MDQPARNAAEKPSLNYQPGCLIIVDTFRDALDDALSRHGCPEIFNTDQGSQFTSEAFTDMLLKHGIKVSMDGKGRFMDNIFVERLWRSLKYEEVFTKAYANVAEARGGIGSYLDHYNNERPHQALGYQTPREVFEAGAGLWICGRSAAPTGSASPMFPPTTEQVDKAVHGNMGKCSPSPTSPQAQQQQGRIDFVEEGKVIPFPGTSPVQRVKEDQHPGGTIS